jgi:hypothetical protein
MVTMVGIGVGTGGLIFTERGSGAVAVVRTRSRFITRGRQQQRGLFTLGLFFVNSLDILLTPASMIFSERRGAAVADTITIYYEGGGSSSGGLFTLGLFFC